MSYFQSKSIWWTVTKGFLLTHCKILSLSLLPKQRKNKRTFIILAQYCHFSVWYSFVSCLLSSGKTAKILFVSKYHINFSLCYLIEQTASWPSVSSQRKQYKHLFEFETIQIVNLEFDGLENYFNVKTSTLFIWWSSTSLSQCKPLRIGPHLPDVIVKNYDLP